MIKKYIPLLFTSFMCLSTSAHAVTANDYIDAFDAYDGSFAPPSAFSIYGINKEFMDKDLANQATTEALSYIENNPFMVTEQSKSFEQMTDRELAVNLNAFSMVKTNLPDYHEAGLFDAQKVEALGEFLHLNELNRVEGTEVLYNDLTELQKKFLIFMEETKIKRLSDDQFINNWVEGYFLGTMD